MWEDNVANIILRTDPNDPLAYALVLELNYPNMSMLGGHVGRLDRDRENIGLCYQVTTIFKNGSAHIFQLLFEQRVAYLLWYYSSDRCTWNVHAIFLQRFALLCHYPKEQCLSCVLSNTKINT